MAGPINLHGIRYNNMGDRINDQEYYVANWQVTLNENLQEMVKKYPGYQINTFGRAFVYRYFYKQLVFDTLFSFPSYILVCGFVFFHTKSWFVSSTSMSMIGFSIPITLVIYRIVFNITNLSSLHLMIVFVVLGISADNIFVLWDAWRQSDSIPELQGDQKKRMAYTFRRAYKALLATSSTTGFAFLSNGFSSLMPVSAFGIFAFILIPMNFFLIIFYYPAFLIVYEN
jgi:predicted RND superfamily exporter protein